MGGSGGGRFWGVRVDGGCERRFEVFVKNQKKNIGGGGGRGEGSGWGGGQGGCERRIEVFVKIQKKNGGGGCRVGGWVRLDVTEELKFLGKFTKKMGGGGCEPRIEGIVQCTKRYCTILRK